MMLRNPFFLVSSGGRCSDCANGCADSGLACFLLREEGQVCEVRDTAKQSADYQVSWNTKVKLATRQPSRTRGRTVWSRGSRPQARQWSQCYHKQWHGIFHPLKNGSGQSFKGMQQQTNLNNVLNPEIESDIARLNGFNQYHNIRG